MKLTKQEYNTIHVWVLRHYDKTGVCEHCLKNMKTEWSNISGLYDRDNRDDWQELCKSCHYKYDVNNLGRITYQEAGRLVGKSYDPSKPNKPRGFAASGLAREAGRKGGLAKRRTN